MIYLALLGMQAYVFFPPVYYFWYSFVFYSLNNTCPIRGRVLKRLICIRPVERASPGHMVWVLKLALGLDAFSTLLLLSLSLAVSLCVTQSLHLSLSPLSVSLSVSLALLLRAVTFSGSCLQAITRTLSVRLHLSVPRSLSNLISLPLFPFHCPICTDRRSWIQSGSSLLSLDRSLARHLLAFSPPVPLYLFLLSLAKSEDQIKQCLALSLTE